MLVRAEEQFSTIKNAIVLIMPISDGNRDDIPLGDGHQLLGVPVSSCQETDYHLKPVVAVEPIACQLLHVSRSCEPVIS